MSKARLKAMEKILMEIHEYFIHSDLTTPSQKKHLERLYDEWKSACKAEEGWK